jgi:hypothetical protein
MSRTRRRMAIVLATFALSATSVVVPASIGNPSPPTNGGNGAGKSGQCTGKAADRPASCQSP